MFPSLYKSWPVMKRSLCFHLCPDDLVSISVQNLAYSQTHAGLFLVNLIMISDTATNAWLIDFCHKAIKP